MDGGTRHSYLEEDEPQHKPSSRRAEPGRAKKLRASGVESGPRPPAGRGTHRRHRPVSYTHDQQEEGEEDDEEEEGAGKRDPGVDGENGPSRKLPYSLRRRSGQNQEDVDKTITPEVSVSFSHGEREEEEEEEEEEEVGVAGDGVRLRKSKRLRGQNVVHDDEEDDEEEEVEGEEEEEEDEEEEEEEENTTGPRYALRNRSKVMVDRFTPSVHHKRGHISSKNFKSSHRRDWVGRTTGPYSRNSSRYKYRHRQRQVDEEVLDIDPQAGWRSLQHTATASVPFMPLGTPWQGGQGPYVPTTPQPAAQTPARQPWDPPVHPPGGMEAAAYGKEKGVAGAEITPLQVDPNITFDQVGGLDQYITSLKEMVFLPLVYPELFHKFHISPPRGVLFYGPPGTGKTLVARALASHASRAGKKVSFFMRKGADILSKWVGEAERQLRLLFEEAQRHQPSIIFFDEIDGLAPVRSSKQDQIHNSIVSTLLALMDGLDPRGQVVVIGATNRVDAIDGALRRPGRFDRELLFPLPNLQARRTILDIHTRLWSKQPSSQLKDLLATMTVGYCGADLKALCTEAPLHALRRRYPQIYDSEDKLLVDPSQVVVMEDDFLAAHSLITPASHRSAAAHARPLSPVVANCLKDTLAQVLGVLKDVFPPVQVCLDKGHGHKPGARWQQGPSSLLTSVQRPRLLLCGPEGAGQNHLGPAILYALEGLPIHSLGLPSLLSDAGARSLEEALVHIFLEARRAAPAILYLPHLQLWWDTAPSSLRATFWMLLEDLPGDLPLLMIATADVPAVDGLDPEVSSFFPGPVISMGPPTESQRRELFSPLLLKQALQVPVRDVASGDGEPPPPLPLAPEVLQQRESEESAKEALAQRLKYEEEQSAIRSLRMALRDVSIRVIGNRRWKHFVMPPNPETGLRRWEMLEDPMSLAKIVQGVDDKQYITVAAFLADVRQIKEATKKLVDVGEAEQYEYDDASALVDEVEALVAVHVPLDLQARCDAIQLKGGPAPPPEGMLVPEQFARPVTLKDSEERPGVPVRASARLKGETVEDRIMYMDPEARRKGLRRLHRGGSTSHGGDQEGAGAGEDDETHEVPRISDQVEEVQQQEEDGEDGEAMAVDEPHPDEGDGTEHQDVTDLQRSLLPGVHGDTLEELTLEDGRGAHSCVIPEDPGPSEGGGVQGNSDNAASFEEPSTRNPLANEAPPADLLTATNLSGEPNGGRCDNDVDVVADSELRSTAESLLEQLVVCTCGLVLEELENRHARLSSVILRASNEDDRWVVLEALGNMIHEWDKGSKARQTLREGEGFDCLRTW